MWHKEDITDYRQAEFGWCRVRRHLRDGAPLGALVHGFRVPVVNRTRVADLAVEQDMLARLLGLNLEMAGQTGVTLGGG